MNNRHRHRRYLKNFLIDKKVQLKLILPVVILSVTLTAALDGLYYFVFYKFLKLSEVAYGMSFASSEILVHMAIVSVVVTLISIAAVSAALIVQTHQILGPLIPITRHIRKLLDGNYNEDLVIRKDDQLHELVKDLNELTKKLRLNNKGQSLVGALVGVAIAGISILAVTAGLQLGQQSQNQVKYIMDLDNFNEEIRALLSDPVACVNSFGGKPAAAGQSYAISDLYDGTPSPGVIKYKVGSVYGDNSLKLNSMTLKDFVTGAISTKAQMTLVNDVSSQKTAIGGLARARTVNLSLDLDASGNIVNCIALAKMSDGIWQRTATNVNNIFFSPPPTSPAGGNVGIGTASLKTQLEVNGSLSAGQIMVYRDTPMNGGGTLNQNRTNSSYQTLIVWTTGADPLVMGGTIQEFTIGESSGQSNILSFNANQAGNFFFNGGNVGIGTMNPQSVLHVNGYLQIKTYSFSPPPADCNNADHVGRMVIWSPDMNTHRICFCPQNIGQGFGWKCVQAI